jgi:hypothetical protein
MPVKTIMLTAGQSNGMCFSTISPIPATYNTAASPTGNAGSNYVADPGVQIWNNTSGGYSTYQPGVNSDGAGGAAWGFEAAFSQVFRSFIPEPLWHLKRAVGGVGLEVQGTGVDDWSPTSTGKEWDAFYNNWVAAVGPISPAICPIFHWAGCETDTLSYQSAINCRANLERFDTAVRDRLGIPDCLFVVTLPPYLPPNGPWTGLVRQAMHKFVAAKPNLRAVLDLDGMPFGNVSSGHFDPSTVVAGGRKLFQIVFEKLWQP